MQLSYGQKAKNRLPEKLQHKKELTVDGKLTDWGDSLRYFYAKQGLQFDLAHDNQYIYIGMRIQDPAAQMQALREGFAFAINIDGKKKAGAVVNFPIPDKEAFRTLMSAEKENPSEDLRQKIMSTVRAIYISGMDDVPDGPISLNNQYGIRAAAAVDKADALCYEAVIPFKRLGLNNLPQNDVAVNMKINGIIFRSVGSSVPMGRRYNPYGYGAFNNPYGYGSQPIRREPQPEPGLWTVLSLEAP